MKEYKNSNEKNRYIQYIVKNNDFGRYFPIFIEIRGIVSYTTNERDMAWFH